MRNKILLLILGVVVGATVTFFFLPKGVEDEVVVREFAEKPASTAEVVEAGSVLPKEKVLNIENNVQIQKTENVNSTQNESEESNAKIEIEGKTYEFYANGERNLYEVMSVLEKEELILKVKRFGSLGYMIEGINGKESNNGYYWTLFINGKESTVGASSYIPNTGDLIEWKYEKR